MSGWDYWNEDERLAYEEGERDGRFRHEDMSRSRHDGPCDRAYFDGYDHKVREVEERRAEERAEEEQQEYDAYQHAMQRRAEEEAMYEQEYPGPPTPDFEPPQQEATTEDCAKVAFDIGVEAMRGMTRPNGEPKP